jgi:c-di-GMP-binding flagellar brake protein YcgR
MVLDRLRKAFKASRTRCYTDLQFAYNHPVTVALDDEGEEYGTAVYDFNETEIVVFVPRGKTTGRRLDLTEGTTVSLTVPQKGAAYQAYARVAAVCTWPQELITLTVPQEWVERQDRQFYRLPVELPLRWAPVTIRGLNPDDFRTSRTLDLSGGGAKFPVDGLHRRGDLLYVQFDILLRGEEYGLLLTGKVVRVEQSLAFGTIVAVQFIDISEREQRLLVDWVAAQQGQVTG